MKIKINVSGLKPFFIPDFPHAPSVGDSMKLSEMISLNQNLKDSVGDKLYKVTAVVWHWDSDFFVDVAVAKQEN